MAEEMAEMAALVTEDWELFDLGHTVLPTKLPRNEFYRHYAGLWEHALQVRYPGLLATGLILERHMHLA